MKGFSQFLVEAETSQAAQAKRLQLTSDGHGGWTDRTGKYVAKTEGGKLVFFKGRGKEGRRRTRSKEKTSTRTNQEKGISKTIRRSKGNKDKRSRFKNTRRNKET